MKKVKLISWNVNGLRAVYNKGFEETFKNLNIYLSHNSEVLQIDTCPREMKCY